eukprot:gnl/Trimastix_PCT/2118.p1 GENE.gnl/Trimastix_PCT/2118~~gnl/Trimastix_PCT/2118.p1  ORF type:complete len:579 (+),score=164.77 gnl/Trimastix_PCT/2118:2028-3764(+)
MSAKGKRFVEPAQAHITPAGITTASSDTAKQCIEPVEDPNRPHTPPEMRRYRQSSNYEPGKQIRHYGTYNDPLPPPGHTFGMTVDPGARASDLISPPPASAFQNRIAEMKEKNYHSHVREPLATSFVRGHTLPSHIDAFGKPTQFSESAKELIAPPEQPPESPEARTMYKRSHGSYTPGEQRKREYDWPVDPSTTVFGRADMKGENPFSGNGARAVLNAPLHESHITKTHLVDAVVDDSAFFSHDELGKPKHLKARPERGASASSPLPAHTAHAVRSHAMEAGGGASMLAATAKAESVGARDTEGLPVDPASQRVFGYPPPKREDTVASLVKNTYAAPDSVLPDRDLGRSVRPGWRNVAPTDRVFGVPTIRTDIPLPKKRSITDNQSYGDEPGAGRLAAPFPYASMGLDDDDYLQPMSRSELRSLLVGSRTTELTPDEFEMIFERALYMKRCQEDDAENAPASRAKTVVRRPLGRNGVQVAPTAPKPPKTPSLEATMDVTLGHTPVGQAAQGQMPCDADFDEENEANCLCLDDFRRVWIEIVRANIAQRQAENANEELLRSMSLHTPLPPTPTVPQTE